MREVTPSQTRTEMTWIVMPGQTNALGTVFGGEVMAWIDVCAAVAAQRFARGPVVTASMDSLLFRAPIRKGDIAELKNIMKQSGHHGMITFDQCLYGMFKEGKITYDDALRYADSANEVRLAVKLSEGGDANTLSANLSDVELID